MLLVLLYNIKQYKKMTTENDEQLNIDKPNNNVDRHYKITRLRRNLAHFLWLTATINYDPTDPINYLQHKKLTIVPELLLENDDLILNIWNQRIWIRKNGEDFEIRYFDENYNKKKTYKCEKEKKYIIWREWNIKIDKSNKTASRKHLELKITNNWDILLKDIAKNWTSYRFDDKSNQDNPFNKSDTNKES